jgi:hypothetical protein
MSRKLKTAKAESVGQNMLKNRSEQPHTEMSKRKLNKICS